MTCRSSIASSSADCVFGEARLISSPRTMLAKIGPGPELELARAAVPDRHADRRRTGSRSGVNCTRPNVQSIDAASALARLVLPTPGTSSISRWPSATRHDERELDHLGLALDDALDVASDPLEHVGEGRCGSVERPPEGCLRLLGGHGVAILEGTVGNGQRRPAALRTAVVALRSARGVARRASRSTSAARSWPPAWSPCDGEVLHRARGARPTAPTPRRCSTRVAWAARRALRAAADGGHHAGRVRRGLRRPDDAGWRGGVAAEHPPVARLPACGAASQDRAGLPTCRRQRRQGAGARRGLARRGARASGLHRRWSCRPASAAASSSTAACSTATQATPATSATSSSSPTADRACAAAGVASRREARAPSIAAITGRLRPRRPRSRRSSAAGLLVGRARGVGDGTARPASRRGRRLGRARLRRRRSSPRPRPSSIATRASSTLQRPDGRARRPRCRRPARRRRRGRPSCR